MLGEHRHNLIQTVRSQPPEPGGRGSVLAWATMQRAGGAS